MKKNFNDIMLIALAALLLITMGISAFFMNYGEFSELENRSYKHLKKFTAESLADGSFFASFSGWYADRFPLRSSLMGVKTVAELFWGKGESGGVYFTKDGYLVPRGGYDDTSVIEDNFKFFDSLSREAAEQNKSISLCLVPRPVDALESKVPDGISREAEEIWSFAEKNGEFLELTETLQKEAERGEYVYFKTDHHWTARGAYVGYTVLGETLGYTPHPLSDFEIQTVSESFLGSSYSKAGGVAESADTVELFRYLNDSAVTLYFDEGQECRSGFYDFSALEEKDKYKVFLGGNYGKLSVTRDGEERERLLLIKDSYANALIPFLSLHYDLTVIDARYFTGSYGEEIEQTDRVLVLQGIDTVATTTLLTKAFK